MGELGLALDLAIVLALALLGGGIALRLRQPVLLGYIAVGAAAGPYSFGLVHDLAQVRALAEIGVALLMFALGIHLRLAELRQVQRVAVFGGAAQIIATMFIGVALGQLLGWDMTTSIYFGALIALSSTMVALKILTERGELDTLHGRVAMGILIVQDLSVVPLMVLLPTLAKPPEGLGLALAVAVVKAALLLAGTFYLGTRAVPWLLFRVAATKSRELFLLAIVSLCLGIAIVAYFLGLSFAFGAFIAGLILSESEFGHQALGEILPLRDLFAVLFFISIGMLVNPVFVIGNLGTVLLVVAVVLVGKFVICSAITRAFGYSGQVALYVGLVLVQMGEFSFVIVKAGMEEGIVSDFLYSLTITVALITIVLSAPVLSLGPVMWRAFSTTPGLRRLISETPASAVESPGHSLSHHVVLCGYGAVGRSLAAALEMRSFRYFVIDYDPYVVMELRQRGVPCVYGDAANPTVLAQANLSRARVLAITLPDPFATEQVIRNALAVNPRLDVIARAHTGSHMELLRNTGATEVVEPKFEAGLEIIRHTLHRYGLSSLEIMALVHGMRQRHYRGEGE